MYQLSLHPTIETDLQRMRLIWEGRTLPLPEPEKLHPLWQCLATRQLFDFDTLLGRVPIGLMPTAAYYIRQMGNGGMLAWHLVDFDAGLNVSLLAANGRVVWPEPWQSDSAPAVDSTLFVRPQSDGWLADSPMSAATVLFKGKTGLAILQQLAAAKSIDSVATHVGVTADVTACVIGLLHAADLLSGNSDEQKSGNQYWSFHDLLLHSRSRLGWRHDNYGGTFPLRDIEPISPVVKPPMSAERLSLPRPDLDRLIAHDKPFAKVVSDRRSIRTYNDNRPINLDEVGEFLYRTHRVKAMLDHDGLPYPVSKRPYPGGGAAYELELYLLVNNCDGLADGTYHYRPQAHELEQLPTKNDATKRYFALAQAATASQLRPQLMILIGARIGRVAWKYESMVYAVILKHVGVLYHHMYLTATAMELAPCAMGGGDALLFAELTGCDPLIEPGVGEFLLGRPG